MKRGIPVALLTMVLAAPWCAAASEQDTNDSLADLELVMGRAIRRVAPSVVRVKVLALSREQQKAAEALSSQPPSPAATDDDTPTQKPASDEGGGTDTPPGNADAVAALLKAPPTDDRCRTIQSGLIVSPDGEVITSLVNVGDQKAGLFVELPDETVYPARRLGQDSQRDLLLLKIEARQLPAPPTGAKTDLAVGQWVMALGRTLPVPTPTASKGIISALGRLAGVAIQTDANVSPVNYGGPLVDLRGRVVGVVAAVGVRGADSRADQWSDSGIGFAIPIDDVLARLPALREGKHLEPPFLGIEFNMVRLEQGAKVMRVIAGTAAAASGLEAGDVIVEFQGQTIETPFQLLHEIGSRAVGDTVTFKVQRNGETLTLTATLGARPEIYRS